MIGGGRGRSLRISPPPPRSPDARAQKVRAAREGGQRGWPAEWGPEKLAQGRFIAHLFTRARRRWPSWVRGAGHAFPIVWRPAVHCQCAYGLNLAGAEEFEEQAAAARAVADWDRAQGFLLKRLESGRTPLILDLFCCAGGVSEGIRRGGGTSFGVDSGDQPEFRARFGREWFQQGDALDRQAIRELVRKYKPVAVWASPPCEASSTATFGGGHNSAAPRLIAQTRDLLVELGLPFIIENVQGAASELSPTSLTLRGQDFGLETERPRLFEAGGGLVLTASPSLAAGGARLRARCCLGARARYAKLDLFGRRLRQPCCKGNIFPVMGSAPSRSTEGENARAMGLDVGHMPFARMAKAIPPAYAALLVGDVMRHVLRTKYGLETPSWDEAQADLPRAKRDMAMWMRGGGGADPNQGVEFESAAQRRPAARPVAAVATTRVGEAGAHEEPVGWNVTLEGAREIELSYAGGCTARVVSPGSLDWVSDLRPTREVLLASGGGSEDLQGGENVFVHVCREHIDRAAAMVLGAFEKDPSTRVAVLYRPEDEMRWLRAMGPAMRASLVMDLGGKDSVGGSSAGALLEGATHARVLAFGQRRWRGRPAIMDRAAIAELMDPVDAGREEPPPKAWKTAVSYSPYPPLEVRRWEGKGLPERIVSLVREGAHIEAHEPADLAPAPEGVERMDPRSDTPLEPGCFVDEHGVVRRFKVERGQYTFPDMEHFQRGVEECDRALLVGHLEPVPAALVDAALARAPAHPWTIVQQSEDKWRAAQDYSCYTNERVGHKPFTLPTVWDAAKVVKPDSHFAKYDLRDGFWAVGVAPTSRHMLMVRHPATGRLLWCRSLPFGYKLSPLIFCDLTESVGAMFRTRVAGMGIHLFVFVDDFLVVGDSKELTQKGMEILQGLFDELGLHWAFHKRRGPARAMEFLGFLLTNDPTLGQTVGLTEGRERKLRTMIAEWQRRRPGVMDELAGKRARSDPKELASLLGHLVFASEVVPEGRTFMQGMLRQFVGLEVDWQRGKVRARAGLWGRIEISPSFWRDLAWWESALELAQCKPMRTPRAGEAAVSGTDASDLACGELVWLDGAREEIVMYFTNAEKRRPINFRELLGVYRLLDRWGERLAGRTILVDIDNTAAVGASAGMFSKAEDMQELIRRIAHICGEHGILMRPVHTPGEMLHRPDQTSRGAPIEEPRQRFRVEAFRPLEDMWGPFTEMIGAERAFARSEPASGGVQTLWAHPTFQTVATALSRIGERMTTAMDTCPRGLIVVPWAPSAPWWRLTKHFTCIARLGVGSRHLEENREGKWVRISARRPSIVLAFPRHLGSVLPLSLSVRREGGKVHILPKGSLLYTARRGANLPPLSSSAAEGGSGCLYLTMEDFGGVGRPKCAELVRRHNRMERGAADFHLEINREGNGGRSLAASGAFYSPEIASLWVVNHFAVTGHGEEGAGPTSKVRFDVVKAEEAIREARSVIHTDFVKRASVDPALSQVRAELVAALGAPVDTDTPMSGLRARPGENQTGETEDDGLGDDGAASGALTGALRRRPEEGEAPPSSRQRLSVTGQPLVAVGYAGMRCAGCDETFATRMSSRGAGVTRITPGGSGMIHDRRACLDQARRKMEAQARADAARAGPEAPRRSSEPSPAPLSETRAAGSVSRQGSEQRNQQMMERVSAARRARVRRCLEGACGCEGEPTMVCRGKPGCRARIHGMACAQISKGHAELGAFTCTECRLQRIDPEADVAQMSSAARESAENAMLWEMTTGAESTGATYADLKKLEREFISTRGGGSATCNMPTDDPEVFKMFLQWLVVDRGRARSLTTLFRAAGTMLAVTRPDRNVTKDPSVKAFFKDLNKKHGEESAPRTAITRRMIGILINDLLGKKNTPVGRRDRLMFGAETMFGTRVGELLEAGDSHGILANNLVILRKLDSDGRPSGRETLEGMLEHSKTDHKRFVNALGVSLGEAKVRMAELLRAYWRDLGLTIHTRIEGGYQVEGPSYFVLRLSLVALTERRDTDEARLEAACRVLRASPNAEAARLADTVLLRGKQRLAGGSTDKKYVNLVSGDSRTAQSIGQVASALQVAGFTEQGRLRVVPGPLFRSTHGSIGHTNMPLSISATYQPLHDLFGEAYAMANAVTPDPELDLRGLPAPLWGHHSGRRGADTVARQTMHLTGATERDIDMVFGWKEAFYSKEMQLHYESSFDRERRCLVTSMM